MDTRPCQATLALSVCPSESINSLTPLSFSLSPYLFVRILSIAFFFSEKRRERCTRLLISCEQGFCFSSLSFFCCFGIFPSAKFVEYFMNKFCVFAIIRN